MWLLGALGETTRLYTVRSLDSRGNRPKKRHLGVSKFLKRVAKAGNSQVPRFGSAEKLTALESSEWRPLGELTLEEGFAFLYAISPVVYGEDSGLSGGAVAPE